MGYQSGGVPVALEAGEIALPPGSYDKASMDYLNHVAFPKVPSPVVLSKQTTHTQVRDSPLVRTPKDDPVSLAEEAAEASDESYSGIRRSSKNL